MEVRRKADLGPVYIPNSGVEERDMPWRMSTLTCDRAEMMVKGAKH
jgi:hypothetical protein